MLEKLSLLVAEEMTLLSRIIRQSEDNPSVRKIEVKSFSFSQELDEDEVIPTLSIQAVLEEQAKVRQQLDLEKKEAYEQLALDRQRQLEELENARLAWQEEYAELKQKAYEEGFANGHADGERQIAEDLHSVIQKTNETTELAIQNGDQYLQSQEQVILELAIQCANRIIGQSVEEQPEVYVDIVKRALVEARESDFIKIYVAAEQYELLTSKREELETLLPPDLLFTIFIDGSLEKLDGYIESNTGRMMVSVDAQLNELKKTLVAILENGE